MGINSGDGEPGPISETVRSVTPGEQVDIGFLAGTRRMLIDLANEEKALWQRTVAFLDNLIPSRRRK